MGKSGRKLSLDNNKLKALFQIIINSAPTPRYVAYGLGVQKQDTIKDWLNAGDVLQAQFEEDLEPLGEIFPFEYENAFETRRLEYDAEFRMMYELDTDGQIPDRLRLSYDTYMNKQKQIFIENNIERKEREFLDSITLLDEKESDTNAKLLIRFTRIYTRAKCVVEMGLLSSINKHSHTSKNVGLGYKLLQNYNREDFGEEQVVKHEGEINVNNKSILSMALAWEKSQKDTKSIDTNKENVIDVVDYKQIENK